MTKSGGNNGSGGGNILHKDIRKEAIGRFSLELRESKLPAVLSSYMSGKNLPAEYRGIERYVKEVRARMIDDIGGSPTQLQMVVLDGICETLLVLKFISTFIGGDPAGSLVIYDRAGNPVISDIALRGFGNFHAILDKKIKQFHDMTAEQKNALSAREVHRRAIMGEHIPTGRPNNENKEMPIRDEKTRQTREMAGMNDNPD